MLLLIGIQYLNFRVCSYQDTNNTLLIICRTEELWVIQTQTCFRKKSQHGQEHSYITVQGRISQNSKLALS